MAVLLSCATGNFLDSTTWDLVNSTAYLNSETNNTALTTSYVSSSNFTPGAITIDGIAVKIASRASSPTGTISIELYNATGAASVAGTEVTINVSDLPLAAVATTDGGWVFFKFSAPVTLLAATNYNVRAKTSNSSQVNLFRDSTAGNWSRALRTTTNQAPAAGDDMIIAGEHTGGGTGNDFTVTMNETASTDYGSNTTSTVTPAIAVCKRGTFAYGASAATNYLLRLSGYLKVYNQGVFTMGTTGTPIPRDSTAILEFDCGSDGAFGLYATNGATLTIQGLSRTSGKNVSWCLLNTDEAANSTSLGVDTDTGWLDNDEIVVATTTQTVGQTEKGTLNGNAGASSLTVDGFAGTGGGVLNAHGGNTTTKVQAEVILLTRNVKIRAVTSTLVTFVTAKVGATVDIDWCEFRYLGVATTDKAGVNLETGSITHCSIYDCEGMGIGTSGVSTYTSLTIDNCVIYNVTAGNGIGFANVTTGSSLVINNTVVLNCGTGGTSGVTLGDGAWDVDGIRVAGCAPTSGTTGSFLIGESAVISPTVTNSVFHSNSRYGVQSSTGNGTDVSFDNCLFWRNGVGGFVSSTSAAMSHIFTNCTFFGNTSSHIQVQNLNAVSMWIFNNCTFNGDASFAVTNGILLNGGFDGTIENCSFGNSVAHTTGDIVFSSMSATLSKINVINTTLASTTEVTGTQMTGRYRTIRYQNKDGSLANTSSVYYTGTITADTTTRHTASGYSWKLTPSSATSKLIYPGPTVLDTMKAAVNASSAVTVTAYVYKDATYNGNAPRLVLKGGIVEGIATDVTDSLTVAHSNWEQLSVTATPTDAGVIEFYIDCDGTAGNVYVDDVAISQ